MVKNTKDYYANAQGLQLRDFLKEMSRSQTEHQGDIYTMEEGFFFLNAVKYKVRAGLKENSTFEDDMVKYRDYKDDLNELGYPDEMLDPVINNYVDAFHAWAGQTEEEFETFIEEVQK